jgi:hypothetical protein
MYKRSHLIDVRHRMDRHYNGAANLDPRTFASQRCKKRFGAEHNKIWMGNHDRYFSRDTIVDDGFNFFARYVAGLHESMVLGGDVDPRTGFRNQFIAGIQDLNSVADGRITRSNTGPAFATTSA